jgi:ubiquinone/menaquinone biosynthesis C-methylase UbiE
MPRATPPLKAKEKMMTDSISEDLNFSQKVRQSIKPLDLEQTLHMLDCQTWFPPSGPNRWDKINKYVKERSPLSQQHESDIYERVLNDLVRLSYQPSDSIGDLKGRWVDIPSPKALYRVKYAVKTLLLEDDWFDCMNMGYADGPEDRPHGVGSNMSDLMFYSRKLYSHVAQGIDIKNKTVLEVGVGRGGGARHLTATMDPASYTGIDLCPANIDICGRKPTPTALHFKVGDAENIPEADDSFDVVLNIESAHCYPNLNRFFGEVRRVLRPEGHLLLGTEWWTERMDVLEREIEASGLFVEKREDITGNIIAALDNMKEIYPPYIETLEDPDRRRVWSEFFDKRVCSDSRESYTTDRFKFLNYVLQKR